MGMHGSLGFTRGAGGVDDHQGVFRLGPFGLEIGGFILNQFMPPVISPFIPGSLDPQAIHHDDMLHRWHLGQRLIGDRFHRNLLPAAIESVRGYQALGRGVRQSCRDRSRAVTGKKRQNDGADFHHGKKCGGGLRHHRQENSDDVPLP